MGDRYMLDFASALRFFSGVIFCANSTKVPRMRLINRGPPCVYACKNVHVRIRWIMATPKSEDALKVSIFRVLKLETIRRRKQKKNA